MIKYRNVALIIIYAGSLILNTISAEDIVLWGGSLVLIFVSAVCMGINVWNLKTSKRN